MELRLITYKTLNTEDKCVGSSLENTAVFFLYPLKHTPRMALNSYIDTEDPYMRFNYGTMEYECEWVMLDTRHTRLID